MSFVYVLGWLVSRFFLNLLYRYKVFGLDNFPKGRVIIASNHSTLADPQIIGSMIFKEMYFMAKKELFSNPVFSFILRKVNSFPISRQSIDKSALKKAISILKKNKRLVVFPEGTRNMKFSKENLKSGFIKLSKLTKTDILPVAVVNKNKKLFDFKKINVYICKKIPYSLTEQDILDIFHRSISEKILIDNIV